MPETCEGCNVISDKPYYLLCEECADKAASYDITLRDRRYLYRTVCNSLDDLNHAVSKDISNSESVILIASAIGRLKVSKEECKPTKSQEERSASPERITHD